MSSSLLEPLLFSLQKVMYRPAYVTPSTVKQSRGKEIESFTIIKVIIIMIIIIIIIIIIMIIVIIIMIIVTIMIIIIMIIITIMIAKAYLLIFKNLQF